MKINAKITKALGQKEYNGCTYYQYYWCADESLKSHCSSTKVLKVGDSVVLNLKSYKGSLYTTVENC